MGLKRRVIKDVLINSGINRVDLKRTGKRGGQYSILKGMKIVCDVTMRDKVAIHCAAIRTSDGHVYTGKHHAACLTSMKKAGIDNCMSKSSQGFMTTRNKFVQRHDALRIALRRKQINAEGLKHLHVMRNMGLDSSWVDFK